VIKRYPNRKLYNTTTKEYITLDKIAEIIRGGEEVHVVDHASGEDLTAMTLTQVLFEQVKQQAGFLPRTVLTGLIQAGGSRLFTVQKALAASLGLRQPVDEEIRLRIEGLVGQGELEPEEGQRILHKLLGRAEPPVEPEPARSVIERLLAARGVATRRELQILFEKVEALAASLEENKPPEAPGHDDDPH
jgi:polyhydroxyalkanoate synthesis repressor PhaR